LGLYDESRIRKHERRKENLASGLELARKTIIGTGLVWKEKLAALNLPAPSQAMNIVAYAHRSDVQPVQVLKLLDGYGELDKRDLKTLLSLVHYDGYLDKQQLEVDRFRLLEGMSIPADIDYALIKGLSIECAQRLTTGEPRTLGQASRMSGITPAAISSLMLYLRKSNHA